MSLLLDLPYNASLNDGMDVAIRLVTPEDKEGIKQGMARLSYKSRLYRFLSPIRSLNDAQLNYLTEIDNKDHLALCATSQASHTEQGIGIARYIRTKDKPEAAEVAVTVIDEYQNRGAGRLLFEQLVKHARVNNIRFFEFFVHLDNNLVRKVLEKCGCRPILPGNGMLRYELDISQTTGI